MCRRFIPFVAAIVFFSGCAESSAYPPEGETDGLQVMTWNIANFGQSKDDSEISYMAGLISSKDVVAIQEVSTGPAGANAVARLADELDRRGSNWDYIISDPTVGDGPERYAIVWRTNRCRLYGKGFLMQDLRYTVDREPFLARFISSTSDTFLLAVFHAVPKSKNPNAENSQLRCIDSLYEKDHLLLMGDFNASSRTAGFTWLSQRKMQGAVSNQRTSLKEKPDEKGNLLANEYDNIYYETDEISVAYPGVINFAVSFSALTEARKISDHIPVYGTFRVK